MAVRNGNQYLRRASCVGFALLLLSTVALCADYYVSGRVLDPKGNSIPGAMIHLDQQQYGLHLQGKTDEQGRFEFSVAAEGDYKIQADVPGFQSVEKIISVSAERKVFNIEMQKLATRNEFASVTAKIEETSINSPDPGERVLIREETLEANPGRPGAPVSIPGIPIETASGGIKAPQYFVPGVAGDHGEPIAQYILVGSYLVPNNLSANAHGNGYADPNIFIVPTIASVQVDAGAFNVLEGNHSVNLAAAYGLQPKLNPFFALNADYRDLNVAAGFSPSGRESRSWIALEASYGNGLLDRLEHRQQYKMNAFRAYQLGNHVLTLFGIGYYGFSYVPGLTPLSQPELHDTIDPRQKDQTHTAEIAANDIWNLGASQQLQFSGMFRTYNLALYSNFGDGLIRQSEFRTVTGENATYINHLSEYISLLAGVDYARDAPRRLDLDHYESTDPNYYGPFQPVTANNVTINDLAPYIAIKGALTKHVRYYAGFRHDEIGFNNADLLSFSNSFDHWVSVNSPKASLSLVPNSSSWLPTASLSVGKAFFTNDPRIGVGAVQGTLVEHARSYQVVVDKLAGKTELRLTLGHVTNDASLAKIDPDTGLQENEGPGRLRFLTAMVRHRFSFGTIETSFSQADARDILTGDPTPEAPRTIFDILGTLDRLPFRLHAKSEFEYVGKKPLGDGFVATPVKEFRGALVRNFRNQKLDLGLNLLIASGSTGQTTEVLAGPGETDPMETVVGVRVPSYVGISASYHF
jgi:hypothetical protein